MEMVQSEKGFSKGDYCRPLQERALVRKPGGKSVHTEHARIDEPGQKTRLHSPETTVPSSDASGSAHARYSDALEELLMSSARMSRQNDCHHQAEIERLGPQARFRQ